MQRDEIFIDRLEVSCRVGDSPEERAFPQTLKVSITLVGDLSDEKLGDDILNAVDYHKVVEDTRQLLVGKEINLIESVANLIARNILKKFSVQDVGVTVSKKPFPGVKKVSVTVWRSRPRFS